MSQEKPRAASLSATDRAGLQRAPCLSTSFSLFQLISLLLQVPPFSVSFISGSSSSFPFPSPSLLFFLLSLSFFSSLLYLSSCLSLTFKSLFIVGVWASSLPKQLGSSKKGLGACNCYIKNISKLCSV